MLKYKKYVRVLMLILLLIFSSTFAYTVYYSKNYPIPLFHRISLDAKMMFIRDMPPKHKDEIDTIVIGSSIGLNNIQGIIMEESSKKIKHVLNLSAFSLEVTHIDKIWDIISLFPNVKRVIYSAQSLDFTGESPFEKTDIDFVKAYTRLKPGTINVTYSLYAYKYFLQNLERHREWKEKHMTNRKFSNLQFDHTGSAPLHIYGDDIIQARCTNPHTAKTNRESYTALKRIIQKARKNNIAFYFVAQPYKDILIKQHEHVAKRIYEFHKRSEKVVKNNHAHFLNLHTKLHLGESYFADRMHLNDKGSILTSKALAEFIDANE